MFGRTNIRPVKNGLNMVMGAHRVYYENRNLFLCHRLTGEVHPDASKLSVLFKFAPQRPTIYICVCVCVCIYHMYIYICFMLAVPHHWGLYHHEKGGL